VSALEADLPRLLQEFFLKRLIEQRGVSPHTVASYRDAFELLLRFAERRTGQPCSRLKVREIDAPLVLAFLEHLESKRGNSPRSRNARLAAIHSFMRYAALRDPSAMPSAKRVLAIPHKRFDRPILGFLTRSEMDAVLKAPDPTSWTGRRDAVLLITLYNTGARVSEISRLTRADALRERGMALRILGKGRKHRVVPLWKSTATRLRTWMEGLPQGDSSPLFPNRSGKALSRSGVRQRLHVAVRAAQATCPSLVSRRVSPHTIRHTTAMHLLQSGVDLSVIALWLGHEDVSTTHRYLEADIATKERALKRVAEPETRDLRYTPRGGLLDFLEGL
jgi:site-specific recombinase XerD